MPKSDNYEYDSKVSPEHNLALAVLAVANELRRIAFAVDRLGFADKVEDSLKPRDLGAVENLALEVKQGFQLLADSLPRPD